MKWSWSKLSTTIRKNAKPLSYTTTPSSPSAGVRESNTIEAESLRSQFATSKTGRGSRRYLPYAFTEYGAVMLANVLNSPTAVKMSIVVVRAFVRLREMMVTNPELAKRIEALEKKQRIMQKDINEIVTAVNQLLTVQEPAIGFVVDRPEKEETDS